MRSTRGRRRLDSRRSTHAQTERKGWTDAVEVASGCWSRWAPCSPSRSSLCVVRRRRRRTARARHDCGPRGVRPGDRGSGRRQGGRRAEGARSGRHRLHGSRCGLLPVHLHGHEGRRTGTCSAGSRTTSTSRRRTSPTEEPEISDDGRTIDVHDPRWGPIQPAGGSRGHRGGRRSTRSSARRCPGVAEPVRRQLRLRHRRLRQRPRRRPRTTPPEGRPRSSGISARRTTRRSDRARRAAEGRDRERDRPDAVAAGERARCRRSTRRSSTRRTPPPTASTWPSRGPYMVENDPETGELTGYTPGKEIKMVRNPNWDGEATATIAPPTWTRSHSRRGSRTRRPRRGRSSAATVR